MKGVTFLPGAVIASCAIGPIVALGGILVAAVASSNGADGLWAAPAVIALAVPFGFMVSILPNLLGATALGWLGRDNVAGRLPVMWALAGAAAAVTLMAPFTDEPSDGGSIGVMAGIGATSALLCRWKTSWD